MNKTALKKFATEARVELLEKVELQARKLGITAESIQKANVESSDAVFIGGKQLSDTERRQRNKLIARINEIGFARVMEETAYTWFNRFIALRYMEVNDYLPTKVRVLSSNSGSAEPDMMKEALSLDLDLDKEKVYDLKMNNETDELFKYLIKMHCNDLNRYMPFMFETIEDYTEILFPEGLLGTDSFVRKMTDMEVIPESNWEKVEIIGWLYQYYISEEKDEVFANLKKNIKITKDTLPAATQLFTPNWIVRYMVENSLGRIWLDSYPESQLKSEWKYYLDEAGQEEEVIKQLDEIRYKNVNPEEITFLDPCCGSGHILVYAFDVFYDMYLEKGYMENEIPQLILEKNLFGLDVDDRAVQLSSFAVMMKAREKSRRIFRQAIQPNICAVQESNWLTDEMIKNISGNNNEIKDALQTIQNTFLDAKEYGSLLSVGLVEYGFIEQRFIDYKGEQADLVEMVDKQIVEEKLPLLLKQSLLLSRNYDVVCTNPPYMGRSGMNAKLTQYLDKYYKESKADLFAAFIERSYKLATEYGYISMITMESWMFLSSYEKLREKIIEEKTISRLIHMPYQGRGRTSLGINFGTSAVVINNHHVKNYRNQNMCIRFNEINEEGVPLTFPVINERYKSSKVVDFNKIPGSPIAYWLSDKIREVFESNIKLGEIAAPRKGNSTSNNNLFLRLWYEVEFDKLNINKKKIVREETISKRWFPYNKGGQYRKWYGNNEYIIDWKNDAEEIRKIPTAVIANYDYFMKPGLTWSTVTSSNFSIRKFEDGFIFDNGGCCLFTEENQRNYFLALLNSSVFKYILAEINPTLNFQSGEIAKFPVIKANPQQNEIVDLLATSNHQISKGDWDNYETSWDFEQHALLKNNEKIFTIENAFENWKSQTDNQFIELKQNEEKLNQVFIEIYGLQHELASEVDDKYVTIRKADMEKDIKSFISYAIGCSYGRYSLDEEGLTYAGGEFNASRYKTFPADEDNILPILQGAYFEDDIVTRFVDFVRVTFGEETLEENLDFVANAIGRRKNETAREALRRYFLNEFYKDHVQVYKKRPIYWLFTSGKEKAFNCLIYMHRYDKTTLSRIRTDYLHEVQIRLDAEKKDLLEIIEGDSTTKEISNAKKELKSLDKKIDELKAYDELLHHMADMQIEIDLDDGVKVNYEKFKGLVAKI
ncbi:BREX-1 system adenine-specific DNA-methyltransferase PglX [Sporosarcina thermotolerans]|uniref:site-specific DNA-methyltransferase (adenine-specific) n=1 Tax=Sporosarcina thermotolerans TaxID=633404 RepID=A0AAW9AC44_9BACL|nr:BREX-1 system adenine-specific DNA-methyltransferase PglX [Sporosarcina thermotolerans]MDW0118614.1 BREX-1 system adenine-specific DNA-methyltransferase PglX [Sporosarcina thermotolerans]